MSNFARAVALSAFALVALASPGTGAGAIDQRGVLLRMVTNDELSLTAPTVDRLADGDVLTVRAVGATSGARGRVRQCVATVSGFERCVNAFPVQFGDDGVAVFQYQVADPGDCDGTVACVVVVDDLDGTRRAGAFTVFGRPAPPAPTAIVSPRGPYEPGQDVQVEVSSLLPGATVRGAFCATTCGPSTAVVADEAGTARLRVSIGERCAGCGIVVVAGVSTTVVDASFVPAPSPAYDAARLVPGLAAAAALLLLAWRIATSVDWRPPSEAQTPELDLDLSQPE